MCIQLAVVVDQKLVVVATYGEARRLLPVGIVHDPEIFGDGFREVADDCCMCACELGLTAALNGMQASVLDENTILMLRHAQMN
jgi:hypothetical protein